MTEFQSGDKILSVTTGNRDPVEGVIVKSEHCGDDEYVIRVTNPLFSTYLNEDRVFVEKKFAKKVNEFTKHSVAASLAIFSSVLGREPKVLLIQRGKDPFKGQYALPGGFVEEGETTVHAAARELKEETGLECPGEVLDLVGVFDAPGRDPRGHVIDVVYSAVVFGEPKLKQENTDDAVAPRWVSFSELTDYIDSGNKMAFDHEQSLSRAISYVDSLLGIRNW